MVNHEKFMPLMDAAKELGVAYVTVHRWCAAGRCPFPFLKLPHGYRVPRKEFYEWLDNAIIREQVPSDLVK